MKKGTKLRKRRVKRRSKEKRIIKSKNYSSIGKPFKRMKRIMMILQWVRKI